MSADLKIWWDWRPMENLKIKAIDLRPLTRHEASRVAAGKPGGQDNWAEGFPRAEDSGPCARLVAATVDPGPFGVYLIVPRSSGQVVGSAGFYGPPSESGEVTIGYGMVESAWGNGYGTAAVAGLIEVCHAYSGVTTVNADTDLENIASQRVLEKNGFERVRATETHCYFALKLVA
ncbi:GNAT family N-acetyltransferase [Micromonospora sp. DR5-3]|uniref:GNAT family N-acetyltransferase n=1 Tax=unclassified Micromonospora TaxID=2617518 RepID=UPI0011D58A9B|nr:MULTISPECIES: GNAT family N-acetyltransferase [unclassified Micromonospora]MCW3820532.1 GNAT family N-acetyltransferase [Micromonospora sp. DR5-3]TYC19837.1 GNAT family N-acetyltransferase [Micromonospora sp. MP36]